MSLETWEQEFYPRPASDVAQDQAIDHSLQKWIGLRPANLVQHGLGHFKMHGWHFIAPDEDSIKLYIDADSCALCLRSGSCEACPLFKVLGCACDGDDSVYARWQDTGDPEPMIAALQKAKENSK